MARRSRADMDAEKQARLQSAGKRKNYSTAIYARLSVENSGKSEDKDVLSNQINQCKAFIEEEPDLTYSHTFSDNGKTGTNFQREGFQNLLSAAEAGLINCIVVRDFSRFGRNRLESVRYISKVFPDLGIRFISVNDLYDSSSGDDSALKLLIHSLVNELYSKDISRKVSTALRSQMAEGSFHKRNLPYGYMWCENRETIIVDEEVADFVRMIFSWKLEGISIHSMTEKLDELDAPLPEARKLQNGVRNRGDITATKWAKSTICSMLQNPHYVGDLVLGRSERALYKGVRPRKVKDVESWFVFPDTHQPLVSREDFESVQNMFQNGSEKLQSKMIESSNERKKMIDLFVKKCYCGDCGQKMYYKKHKNIYHGKKGESISWSGIYNCSTNIRRLTPKCSPHHTRQSLLEEKVLSAIKTQVKIALDYEILLNQLRDSTADKSVRDKQNALISSLKLKLNGAKQKLDRLYTDYLDGILTLEEYSFTKQSFLDDVSNLEIRLEEITEQKLQYSEAMSSNNKWITLMKSVSKKKKLSQTLVDTTIEKIFVYEDNRIDLVMKFNDIFELMKTSVDDLKKEVHL